MNLELSTHFQHTEDRWSHRSTRDCMDKSEDLTSEEIPKFHEIANAVFSLCKYLKLSPFMFVTLVNAVVGHSESFLTMFHRKTRLSDKMPFEIRTLDLTVCGNEAPIKCIHQCKSEE